MTRNGCPPPDVDALRDIVSEWSPATPATRTIRWVRYMRHRMRPRADDLPNQERPFASGAPRFELQYTQGTTRSKRSHSVMSDVAPSVVPTMASPVVPDVVRAYVPPRTNRQGSNVRVAVDDYFGIAALGFPTLASPAVPDYVPANRLPRVNRQASNVREAVDDAEVVERQDEVVIHVEEIKLRSSGESMDEAPRRRFGYSGLFSRLLRRFNAATAEWAERSEAHSPRLALDRQRTPRSVAPQRSPKRSRLGRIRKFEGLKPVCAYCALADDEYEVQEPIRGTLPESASPCCQRAVQNLKFLDAALQLYRAVNISQPDGFVDDESADTESLPSDSMGMYALHRCPGLSPRSRELRDQEILTSGSPRASRVATSPGRYAGWTLV